MCSYFQCTNPHVEFELQIESNDLTFRSEYSKRQLIVYKLIKHLYEINGLGYRKISYKLNSWGIKTQRGKSWSNTSVSSILKRKRERELRIKNQRSKLFEVELSRFIIKDHSTPESSFIIS